MVGHRQELSLELKSLCAIHWSEWQLRSLKDCD